MRRVQANVAGLLIASLSMLGDCLTDQQNALHVGVGLN